MSNIAANIDCANSAMVAENDASQTVAPCGPSHQDTLNIWGDRPSITIGARILKSLARARAAIIHESPPIYSRGAWAIINDVPYPPPPPYAGSSRHPPTYSEALEIGVVASPLRVEQRMRSRHCLGDSPSQSATASSEVDDPATLTECSAPLPDEHAEPACANGGGLNASFGYYSELLPEYTSIDDTASLSPVVRQWRLGQPAFEKPPRHPRGFINYDSITS
ncbi:hypothetical protein EV174_000164 [Coemansia sp. RSA 2320]|nr:hypothetical protein EV174_000164 [Coemansia sp. RSA 2320]